MTEAQAAELISTLKSIDRSLGWIFFAVLFGVLGQAFTK